MLGLSTRFMSERQIDKLQYLIDDVEENGWRCRENEEALDLFDYLRERNLMGNWRGEVLHRHWTCEYPGDKWLADKNEPNRGECESLGQWLPETWVLQKFI